MDNLYNVATDVKKAAEVVVSNMIAARPRAELKYRPYRLCEAVSHENYLSWEKVNLKMIYPEVEVGDRVFVGFNLVSGADYDAAISVQGNVKKIFFEGEELISDGKKYPTEMLCYPCRVRKGNNKVTLLCECEDAESFVIGYVPSTIAYPKMWARDYLLYLGVFSPIEEFSAEEGMGVSSLFRVGEALPEIENIEYVWPRIENHGAEIDFDDIFSDEKGEVAYALSYALEDTIVSLSCTNKVKVFINGKEEEFTDGISIKKDDTILLKVFKENGYFGKVIYNDDAMIGIPFLESNRGTGDKWLTLGTFAVGAEKNLPLGPELELQFTTPYLNNEWKPTFWKLNSKNDFVRPYTDSFFFGQWFYAIMVGHYGILQASKLLENEELLRYFIDGIGTMSKFYEYSKYEKEQFEIPAFIGRAPGVSCLDNIGTIGMNMCELYRLTGDKDALSCLRELDACMHKRILRFEDGAFYRGATMWADDVYMCCPMLARMGQVFQERKYFEECVTQIRGFKKRLWRSDAKLFSHIFFVNENCPNEISWGRGNGWIFLSLADILPRIPDDVDGKDELLAIFREFAESLMNYQDADGLWHQVLDQQDSYQETSATTMFLWGMSRGVNQGILSKEKYAACVKRTYEGLLKFKIDSQGNVHDVCRGSGCSMDVEYYKTLKAVTNDDHGTGLILAAFEEYSRTGI